MWVPNLLCRLVTGTLLLLSPTISAQNSTNFAWPIQNNGYQSLVEWDHYSLLIDSERYFLFSGEFHPWRLPVPELWEDILQKIKALGMRMVSIYLHWGFHAPDADTLDFETAAHNIERFFEMARDIGLYVQVRPGPYINAETNAGGMPLWVTTGAYGNTLRTNSTEFTGAWTPYQTAVARLVQKFQVTENGTVLLYQIENEDSAQWTSVSAKTPNEASVAYFELLEANARGNGIVVPTIHNAPNVNGKSWSSDYDTVGAGGNVDITGLDSYPSCWSCVPSDCSTSNPSFTLLDYWDYFQAFSPNQPPFSPEFQGGALNPWDGPAGGCAAKTNESFVNFYYRDNVAQGMRMFSLYMIHGGTNWGGLACPITTSSYGYSAAIAEDRSIGGKYNEIKLLGLFTRVANELTLTDLQGNGSSYTDNSAIHATVLKNPDTGAGFYVLRHGTATSNTYETFKLNVSTSQGALTIPQWDDFMVIDGHESKIIVTDFHFGSETLLYSTAEVLTYSIIDGNPVLVIWVPTGLSGEFFLEKPKSGSVSVCNGCSDLDFHSTNGTAGIGVTFTQGTGMSVLRFDTGLRVVLADRTTAYEMWVPPLTADPTAPADRTALVVGPTLVRSATLDHDTIVVKGDSNSSAPIEVFTTSKVTNIQWNGRRLPTKRTWYGSLKAVVPTSSEFSLPKLGGWKVKDSLPERLWNYSDTGAAWVAADHTNHIVKTSGTVPYLFSDEYNFHTGVRLWRGHFASNGTSNGTSPSSIYLSVQGGTAFGFSTWLNGKFMGSFLGSTALSASNITLALNSSVLDPSGSNVLLVMHDDTGHDEGSGATNPRGILNATLIGGSGSFSSWRLAGTAGGSQNITLDPVRTLYNEGGLTAERLGWHLPGFDDSDWEDGRPDDGFDEAGVRFYRAIYPLQVPEDLDVGLAFTLTPNTEVESFRVHLYVNGYQYGRFYPVISVESTFPVPPGVLNYNGDNVIGIALWAQTSAGASVAVDVSLQYAVQSSLDVRFDGTYLRPGWNSDRLAYA